MSQRKVLYLSPNSKKGGAEQLTLSIAGHHDRTKWIPEFFFFADGPFVAEVREAGIDCHVSRYSRRPRLRDPMSVWLRVRELKAALVSQDISIVHSVMGYAHLFGGPAALAAGVPEVWFQHGPTGSLDWLTGRFPTQVLFVNSRHTLRAQKRYRARAKKVVVVYPGVSVPELSAKPATGRPRIGIFGRLSPMKGHHLFLEALAALKTAGIECEGVICGGPFGSGDEAYARALKDRVKELRLGACVEFTGHVNAPPSIMSGCQVVVNCTTSGEPFGMTIVEAMALGVAVVAPRSGGPLEIITDGKDGLLYREGDAADLAMKLKSLLTSGEARARIASAAATTAMDRFSIQRTTAEIEAEYASLASVRKR